MDENALAVAGTEDGHLHFTASWRRSQTHFPIPGFCRSLRLRAERRRAHVVSRPAGGEIEQANAASAAPFCRYSLQCSSRRWRLARRAPCPRRIPPTNRPRPPRPESADRDRRGEPETRRSRLPIRRPPSVRMRSRRSSSRCSATAWAADPALNEWLARNRERPPTKRSRVVSAARRQHGTDPVVAGQQRLVRPLPRRAATARQAEIGIATVASPCSGHILPRERCRAPLSPISACET